MRIFSKTDIGTKRSENQDRVWTGRLGEDAVAVVLCDGMGGENAGSRASQLTVDVVSERLEQGFREDAEPNSIRNLLVTSVAAANAQVYGESISEPDKHGMGTTCVAAIVSGNSGYIVNVGDSRAYYIFDDSIKQITKDHTYVRNLVEDGEITEEESLAHPDRNAITRAIGAEAAVLPDYFEIEMPKQGILLLCSDGLHSFGSDAAIGEIIVNNLKDTVCDLLVDYAISNGGKDNVTVAIVINN